MKQSCARFISYNSTLFFSFSILQFIPLLFIDCYKCWTIQSKVQTMMMIEQNLKLNRRVQSIEEGGGGDETKNKDGTCINK